MKNLSKKTKIFQCKVLLSIITLIFFLFAGCKKPDKGGNGDDNIQPMYGVRMSIFK